MAIKAIIFDCFGVLVMPGREMLQQTYPQFVDEINNLLKQSDFGVISHKEFMEQASSIVGLTESEIENSYYNINVRNQQLLEWAQQLKDTKKYKIGMLSNVGHNWLNDFLRDTNKTDLFDEIILSSDVSIIKPDPAIFELIATRLGFDVSECVMIDDLLKNIEGASIAGMHSILYGSNKQVQEDFKQLEDSLNA